MTTKEYLGQAYRIEQRINCKLEQVASLHDLAEKATSTLSDMPHSPNRNIHSMENVIVKLMDMENEINTEIQELIRIREDINAAIQAAQDSIKENKNIIVFNTLLYYDFIANIKMWKVKKYTAV